LYIPANPFQFHLFDAAGRHLEAVRPVVAGFRNAPLTTSFSRSQSTAVDWVVNAAVLPGGNLAAHVIRRGEGGNYSDPVPYSHLNVFGPELNLVAGPIAIPKYRFPGLLLGADSLGNLYFGRFSVPEGGAILKVRVD
jgi:hypothetical protein